MTSRQFRRTHSSPRLTGFVLTTATTHPNSSQRRPRITWTLLSLPSPSVQTRHRLLLLGLWTAASLTGSHLLAILSSNHTHWIIQHSGCRIIVTFDDWMNGTQVFCTVHWEHTRRKQKPCVALQKG